MLRLHLANGNLLLVRLKCGVSVFSVSEFQTREIVINIRSVPQCATFLRWTTLLPPTSDREEMRVVQAWWSAGMEC